MNYYLSTTFNNYNKQHKVCGFKIGKPIPTIDLISIGIVTDEVKYLGGVDPIAKDSKPKINKFDVSREYYAVSKDFDIDAAWNKWQWKESDKKPYPNDDHIWFATKEYWLRENVIIPICKKLAENENTFAYGEDDYFTLKVCKKLIKKYGKTNIQIANKIKEFCYLDDTVIYSKTPKHTKVNIGREDDIISTRYYSNNYQTEPIFYTYNAEYDWVLLMQLLNRLGDLPKDFPEHCIGSYNMLRELYNRETEAYKKNISFYTWLITIQAKPQYPKQELTHNDLKIAILVKKLHKFLNSLQEDRLKKKN